MRINLIAVILAAVCLQVSAKGYAQITISETSIRLDKLLTILQDKTDYTFFYNNKELKDMGWIEIHLTDVDLKTALDRIFVKTPLDYAIVDQTVVIRKRQGAQWSNAEPAMQQARTINGRVVDNNGAPLPGVSVRIKRGSQITPTDNNGEFSLSNVSENAVIVFTMLGFESVEYAVNRMPEVVSLLPDTRELDAVLVTGYGVQERRTITGSIASVRGEDIENMPVQSFDKAIQGRAAGVLIQSSTGVPGGAVRVNIRGVGSITAGTEPMYIVDGVQLNSSQPGARTSTNAMAHINPNDIESVEILKDAAAAAIYGSQAANGVILITTKKGKAGKTRFSVNYYEGISAAIKNMDVLTTQEAVLMRQEAVINNQPSINPQVAFSQALTAFGLPSTMSDEEFDNLPTYDWQSEAFKPGSVRNLEFSTSGGTADSRFYMSGAYNKHDGNVTGIDFERGSFRLRVNQQVDSRLSLDGGVNLSMITQNGNTGSAGNTGGSASPQLTVSWMPPSVPIYNPDGSFNAYSGMPGTGFNPIQAATIDDNITRQRALIGNFSASYRIIDDLVFKSFYGIDYRYVRADYYRDPRTPNGAPWNGYLIDDNIENVNFTTNQTLTYNRLIGDRHQITALAGFEYRSDVQEAESARANQFPTYQFRTNQSAAEPYQVTGGWSGSRRLGFFGQVNYAYDNKLFLSAVMRYDGSSRFGRNNRFGLFPGISAGWDIAQEQFISSSEDWLNQLKLRFGYGVVGNDQINNVSSRGFYQGGTQYNNHAALRLQTLANPELGWERNVSVNIGLDYSLLNNRIAGTFEVFQRNSHDLLLDKPLPLTSGFSNVDDNLGRLVNKGVEIDFNTINITHGDFRWSSNFNIAFLKNEVVELYDGLDFIAGTIRVGHPLKIWHRPRYAGVNSLNGRSMWYDKDGNITYVLSSDDNVETKKGWQSDYFGGFSNTFSYKGLDLGVLFHFDMGRYMANTMYQVWYQVMNNSATNTLRELYENRWTEPGQITYIPRVIAGGAERNSSARQSTSTLFLHDASFVRLREVSLGYRLPSTLLDRFNVGSARVFVNAVNLVTWTNWVGYDPEFAIDGAVANNQGIVPQTRSFTAGIQLGF